MKSQYVIKVNGVYFNSETDYEKASDLRDRLQRQFPNKKVEIEIEYYS